MVDALSDLEDIAADLTSQQLELFLSEEEKTKAKEEKKQALFTLTQKLQDNIYQ